MIWRFKNKVFRGKSKDKKLKRKKKTVGLHMQIVKLIHFWSTFWFSLQHSVVFGRCLSALHVLTWQHLPTPLCQSALTLSACQNISCAQPLQITSLMFTLIQVWVLAGPLQNFNLFLQEPCFHRFGRMLWVGVELMGEISLHLHLLIDTFHQADPSNALEACCRQGLLL